MIDVGELKQAIDLPDTLTPVVIFGAGSIVSDAHLPAYKAIGVPVAGIFDPDMDKAGELAAEWGTQAFATPAEATADPSVIYDLAVPPAAIPGILRGLPDGAIVLIQKPLGSDLAEADAILKICREKDLKAAVNFQLRYAPHALAMKDAIDSGILGDVVDFDIWIAIDTPWHHWEFLANLPRVEILLHSIHYLDLIREVLGDPSGIHARTMGHPSSTISNTRTSMMLDYGDQVRCNLSINHTHTFGRRFQACEFRICGTKGAAYMKLGANIDYPRGEADALAINAGDGWQDVPLRGNWFTEGFEGRFAQVQRYAAGLDDLLAGSVEDAWHTMALVEAAYESASKPMHPIKESPDA